MASDDQKPSDQDLQCFQKRRNPDSARQVFKRNTKYPLMMTEALLMDTKTFSAYMYLKS